MVGSNEAKAARPLTAKSAGDNSQFDAPSTQLKLASATHLDQRTVRDEARLRHEERLSADTKATDAVLGLARLDQIGGRSAEAEAGFRRAVRMENASGRTLDALGQFYADQHRWNDAILTLQKASAAVPDNATVRFHYAIALAKSGQISQAIPLLRSAVEPADVHYNIGVILYERGDLAGSEEQFRLALEENPDLPAAQQWLANVHRDREREFDSATRRQSTSTAAIWDQ
jgi:Tfp pilus assembly protein PilF